MLHEGNEYRLRQTVQNIRDSSESGDINAFKWIQSRVNISYALRKRN